MTIATPPGGMRWHFIELYGSPNTFFKGQVLLIKKKFLYFPPWDHVQNIKKSGNGVLLLTASPERSVTSLSMLQNVVVVVPTPVLGNRFSQDGPVAIHC